MYELFSKLSGFKDHNTAKSKDVVFVERVYVDDLNLTSSKEESYSVKLSTDYERKCTKYYNIPAKSEEHAKEIMQEYINVQTMEIEPKDIKHETTIKLLAIEDSSEFEWGNWNVEDSLAYGATVEWVGVKR